MSDNPTFSVIMACHNAAPYVQQAIESVVNQKFTAWELIIVDDASQDDSLLYIEKAALIEPRIKLIKFPENVGVAAARNAAIKIAKGEWLAILDADDVFLPEKLEKQCAVIQQCNLSLVLVGAGCFHINSEGLRAREYYNHPASSKALKKNLHRFQKFPPHSSLIYRASAFREVGGFNETFILSEDFDLLLRLGDIGQFTSYPSPLIEYRYHSTNISNLMTEQGFSQYEYSIAARVCQLLRHAGHPDPSSGGNNQLWNEFMSHIANIFRKWEIQNYFDWKSNFKAQWYRSNSALAKMFCFGGQIAQSPTFVIRLLKEQTRGIGLPEQCFKSWVQSR